MFLALRELRAARGRFALMGSVVVLVSALVGVVSGFTLGLGDDTVSALRRQPVSHFAFSADSRTDQFARSLVGPEDVRAWQAREGVEAAPFGVSITRGTTDRGVEVDLAAFGVQPGSFLAPRPVRGSGLEAGGTGVVISRKLADEGVRVGDTLVIERAGLRLPVLGVTGRQAYGHVPVAYVPLDAWRAIRFGVPGQTGTALPEQYTAVALRAGDGADAGRIARELGNKVLTREESFEAAPGYTGERVTMTSILVFLYLIAPLVVGAFFAVWTVQRKPELALLRAMGASRARLAAGALTQAAIVVVVATAIGGALAGGLGLLMGGAVPFSLPASQLVLTMLAVAAAALAGTVLTLRQVTSADPMTMLGAER